LPIENKEKTGSVTNINLRKRKGGKVAGERPVEYVCLEQGKKTFIKKKGKTAEGVRGWGLTQGKIKKPALEKMSNLT